MARAGYAPQPSAEDARRERRVAELLEKRSAVKTLVAKERVELRRLVAAEITKLEDYEAHVGLTAPMAKRLGDLRAEQDRDAKDKARARAARQRASEDRW